MSPPDASPAAPDDSRRATAPGFLVELAEGGVHCRWDGPEDGPVVVMIHGFSLHHVAFDHNVPALTAAGYRVLRMDNYGRGWSDRPLANHDADLFDRQVGGVLDALGLRLPLTLIGYSMGGAIAITFAARHPERVARLALIAPAGLPFRRPAIAYLLTVPVLGEILMRGFGRATMLRGMARLVAADPRLSAEYVAKVSAVIDFPGFQDALLSTLRHYPLNDLQKEWRQLGSLRISTLLLWGDRDRTVPFPGQSALRELMPAARLEVFAGEDHGIPMIVSAALNAALLRFLSVSS